MKPYITPEEMNGADKFVERFKREYIRSLGELVFENEMYRALWLSSNAVKKCIKIVLKDMNVELQTFGDVCEKDMEGNNAR